MSHARDAPPQSEACAQQYARSWQADRSQPGRHERNSNARHPPPDDRMALTCIVQGTETP